MTPVSVIITTFKEEKTIKKAISSFLPQLTPKDELIVIAPDKPTLTAAKKSSSKVKTITDTGQGKPSALNQAIKVAKNPILVLTDGDVYSSPDSLKHLLPPFKDSKVGIVSSFPTPTNSRDSLYGFWAYLATQTAHLQRTTLYKKNLPLDCSGYLLALRKSLFKPLPKDTLADDALITQNVIKQGYKTAYAPNAQVFVKYPTNLKDWISQKVRSVGGASFQIKNSVMRGPLKEIPHLFTTLTLIRSPQQFIYWFLALLFRLYLWIKIFIDLKLKKPTLKKVWTRIESTK